MKTFSVVEIGMFIKRRLAVCFFIHIFLRVGLTFIFLYIFSDRTCDVQKSES